MLTEVFYLSFFVFTYKQSLLNCPEAQVSYLPSKEIFCNFATQTHVT